jgi:hypothetical protein
VKAVQEMGQSLGEAATGEPHSPPARNTASDFGQSKQTESMAGVHSKEHGRALSILSPGSHFSL